MLLLKAAVQTISEGTAVIIAAIVGAVLSALLQVFGAFAIDYLAGRREERRAKREDQVRQEQWKRDDELRRQEQEREEARRREQQEREEKRHAAEERARVYKRFVAATTFALPLAGFEREKQLHELNESFTDVQLYASDWTLSTATQPYESAVQQIRTRGQGDTTEHLEMERATFWSAARDDLRE